MADPTDVTGLLRRWRADTIAQANNSAVSSWAALTGGATLAQATGSLQPLYITSGINGHPVVRFDGVDDMLTATITDRAQPHTWIVVAKLASTGSLWKTAIQSGSEVWADSGGWTGYAGTGLITSTHTTNPAVVTTVINGGSSAVYIDGGLGASGAAGSLTTGTALAVGEHPNTGLSRPFDGDIAEILLYDHALTAGERATVHSYVQDRYGITVSDYVPSASLTFVRPVQTPTARRFRG